MTNDKPNRRMAVACADVRTGEVALWLNMSGPTFRASEPDALMDRKTARWLARQLLEAADMPDELSDMD